MGGVVSLVSVFAVVVGVGFGSPAVAVVSLSVICFVRAGVGCGGFVWFYFAFGGGPGHCSGAKKAGAKKARGRKIGRGESTARFAEIANARDSDNTVSPYRIAAAAESSFTNSGDYLQLREFSHVASKSEYRPPLAYN